MHKAGAGGYGKISETIKDTALALTFSEDLRPRERPTLSLRWTSGGLAALQALREAVSGRDRKWSLPHRPLVAMLELEVPGITRVWDNASLRADPERHDLRIAWIDAARKEAGGGALRAVGHWITGELAEATRRVPAARGAFDRVRTLYEDGGLLTLVDDREILYPWTSHSNGTTSPPDRDAYQALADHVARALEGAVVLEGLSPLRRIVSRFARFGGNEARLMTDPVSSKDGGLFSLLVKARVLSLPGVGQPILELDVGKRRWVSELDPKPFGRTTVGGYALPADRTIAASFGIEVKDRAYSVGPEYAAIARRYRLPPGLDAFAIARGDAHTDACRVHVNLRHGFGSHQVDAGVPEREKLEVFERAEEILAPAGFRRWDRLRAVPTKNTTSNGGGRLHVGSLEIDLETFGEEERIAAENKRAEAEKLVELNRAALRRHHPEEPLLVIVYHGACGEDARKLERHVQHAMGGVLRTTRTPVPEEAHGPRRLLPLDDARPEKRARQRRQAWRKTAEGIRRLSGEENVVGCLVIAPDRYDGMPDDTVNKEAGRNALAAEGRVPTQYLLPTGWRGEDDFVLRAQNALGDLLWAHQGRVDGVREAVRRLFPDGNGPEEIIGIAVIRRNGKPGGRKASVLPVAMRLNVADGLCTLRFARETPEGPSVSDWAPFRDALCDVAAISPVSSSGQFGPQRACFEGFCDKVITEACDSGSRPLVLVHSTHARGLWSWVSDTGLDGESIDFETAGKARHRAWRDARIARVRLGYSPQVVRDKRAQLARLEPGDGRSAREIEPEFVIRSPTSPNGVLYRVEGSALPAYLSVGGKMLHKHKRGVSCYRAVELLGNRSVGETDGKVKLYDSDVREPYTDQWPTPNPVEIVIPRMLDGDSADRVAEFVEGLRSGYGHFPQWTTLPAPLFFERVVDDYVADFAGDDGEA